MILEMKPLFFTVVCLLAAVTIGAAEEPSLSVYEIIKEDIEKGVLPGELILKVTNPTDHPFYVLGWMLSDIPHIVEIQKNGKWSPVPVTRCGFGMTMRTFKANSYLVCDISDLPLMEDDCTFRVRVYLYTEPDIWNVYTEPKKKPYIELVSQSFSTKDFRTAKANEGAKGTETRNLAPRIPGLEPIPESK